MARLAFTGFETGSVLDRSTSNLSTAIPAAITFDTGIFRTGLRSLKVATTSGVAALWPFGTDVSATRYGRVYMRVTAAPAATPMTVVGNTAGVNVRLNASGTLSYYNVGSIVGTSAVALTDTSRWYRVEWRSGGTGVPLLLVDGQTQITGNGGADFFCSVGSDGFADTYTVYFDDVTVDDAAFPGPGAVALLVPAAQNSVTASTWQKPGGAVTNMHTSVDNTPPVGLADSTNSAQAENFVRNAVSNATADVVFDMTTYTAAGIANGSTVNAVQAFACTAAPSATSPANGSLETTNPAQAEVNFGTFYHGSVTAGTFPTGWKRISHTLTSAPAPTLGTAPTVEVGKRTASIRIGQVCFVGMHVDYTPPADNFVPTGARQIPQLLAH